MRPAAAPVAIGGYIVSDWNAGTVFQITGASEAHLLREFVPGTADLGFVSGANVVLVPHMNENTVAAYDVSGMLQ